MKKLDIDRKAGEQALSGEDKGPIVN
jgi:hypothetical protein